jgi:hypothetical protein
MFATLLMLYRNYEKQAGLNTEGRLHQQPRKDPVNRLMHFTVNTMLVGVYSVILRIHRTTMAKHFFAYMYSN